MSIIVADTLPMQMEQLGDGLSKGQVGQRPFEMGYKAMFIMKELKEGKAPFFIHLLRRSPPRPVMLFSWT